MSALERAVAEVRAEMAAACRRSGRDPAEVRLVAVSKTVRVEIVREARRAGLADFGENRAAELAAKAPEVAATWHFLGRVQTGTASRVADHADVIHSAEPGRAMERIGRRAAGRDRVIDCLIQVDFTGARQGVAPEDVREAVGVVGAIPGLRLQGLMTMPPWSERPEESRPYFARLRSLRDDLRRTRPDVRDLSMGMSGDYGIAIEEGATMVRIGTALFGERAAGRGVG